MNTEEIIAIASGMVILAMLVVVFFIPRPVSNKTTLPNSMINLTVDQLKDGEGGWIEVKKSEWDKTFKLDTHRQLRIHDDVSVKLSDKPWGYDSKPKPGHVYIHKVSQGLILTIYEPYRWNIDENDRSPYRGYNKVKVIDKSGDSNKAPVTEWEKVEKKKSSYK